MLGTFSEALGMTPNQARGYIFEYIVLDSLKQSGYINVTSSTLRGRGASHQIDAYGTLSIPTADLAHV